MTIGEKIFIFLYQKEEIVVLLIMNQQQHSRNPKIKGGQQLKKLKYNIAGTYHCNCIKNNNNFLLKKMN